MNDYRIAFTTHAKDDIINIGDYITFTLLAPDTSNKFIKGLKNSILQLKYLHKSKNKSFSSKLSYLNIITIFILLICIYHPLVDCILSRFYNENV